MDTGVPFLLTLEFDGGPDQLRLAARAQIVARRYGLKPTWLVGARALAVPSVLEPFSRWQREGEAEVGALVEPALVPPLVDLGALGEGRRPFLTAFPESIIEEKLTGFTATLGAALGRPPTTIRLTPPSVDDRYYALLTKLGYRVDLTVVPHAKVDTSDFTGYSEKAYLTPQGILEVPRTVRRRRYHPFIEDLLTLPGLAGTAARVLFPILRCYRLRAGSRPAVRVLSREATKGGPGHLDLRVGARDWDRGEALIRDLQRTLASVQTQVVGLSADEFYQRFKNDQLRKALV